MDSTAKFCIFAKNFLIDRELEIVSLQNIDIERIPCVLTIGMYDGVHIGHQQMLKELSSLANKLNTKSIVVTFTNHPRQVLDKKNDNPLFLLQTINERFDKISTFGIDYIIPITFTKEFAHLTPKQFLDSLLEKLDIKILLLGYDNRFGNPNNNEYEDLLKKGYYKTIKIEKDLSGVYFEDIEVSSTQIRKAISKGDIKRANAMLGNPYSLSSKVVPGLQNGNKLGFPTANILPLTNKIIPYCGVYATKTIIDKNIYNSITNIGDNPTFNAHNITIETYIIDFNRDIYDKEITIQFIDYIRPEQKFASVEELKTQMNKDLQDAKKIFCI